MPVQTSVIKKKQVSCCSHRLLIVLKSFSGLLIGADLLTAFPLNVPKLNLLQQEVRPPQPPQHGVGCVCWQEHCEDNRGGTVEDKATVQEVTRIQEEGVRKKKYNKQPRNEETKLRFVNRTAGVKQQRKSDSSLKRRQKCKKKKKKVSKEGRKIRKPENETKNAEPQ